MADKPIIQASLVDTRNVGTDKELKIELRIPAEMATRFFEIFGWPTRVSPVPVALVPLKGGSPQEAVSADAFERNPKEQKLEILDEAIGKLETVKHREDFTKLSRVRQAGIRCSQPDFWGFLNDKFRNVSGLPAPLPVTSPDEAAIFVRWWCMVESRRELDNNRGGGALLWERLEAEFYAKSHGMRQ